MNQDDVIQAFVLQASKNAGPVSFGRRGAPQGYTKVFGPNANPRKVGTCHISIEHVYDAVSVTAELARHISIAKTPRRGQMAPGLGRFQHDILLADAQTTYGSAAGFVEALVNAARTENVW